MKKIKENDIFYSRQGITVFYQVVKVYESGRVRIREIEKVEKPTECGYEFLATPLKNKFCPKREISEEDKKYYIDNYIDIIDNDKGAIKLVKFFDDDSPYISLKGHDYATLYEGEPVISNYWYVWMK